MNEAIKQLESPLVGVVWGRMRITNAKNDRSALLTDIGLRCRKTMSLQRVNVARVSQLIGRSETEPARVTGWRQHCVKALWKLGKC